jgi:hypothetical protein
MRAAWELSDGLGELLTGQLAPTKHRAELTQSQGGAQRLDSQSIEKPPFWRD